MIATTGAAIAVTEAIDLTAATEETDRAIAIDDRARSLKKLKRPWRRRNNDGLFTAIVGRPPSVLPPA